jgi:hypothetical protein
VPDVPTACTTPALRVVERAPRWSARGASPTVPPGVLGGSPVM